MDKKTFFGFPFTLHVIKIRKQREKRDSKQKNGAKKKHIFPS